MRFQRTFIIILISTLMLIAFHNPTVTEAADKQQPTIARIWHGMVPAAKAEEYTKYLNEHGITKVKSIPGNLGVQMLREVSGETADFVVISYWSSIDAIKKFAGEDYEKVYHLPRDPEFLINPEKTVRHFEVIVNDWK